MKIKILETKRASPNGVDVYEYKEGEVYDLPEDLAKSFISQGVAEEVKVVTDYEDKVVKNYKTKVVKTKKK